MLQVPQVLRYGSLSELPFQSNRSQEGMLWNSAVKDTANYLLKPSLVY